MKSGFPLAAAAATLFALAGVIPLRAQQPSPSPSPSAFDQLEAAARAELDAFNKENPDVEGSPRRRSRMSPDSFAYIQSLRAALTREDDATAMNLLMQVSTMAETEDLRKACAAVLDQLRKTHAEHEAALTAKVNDAIQRAGEIVRKAKEPKELDPVLEEFYHLGVARTNRYVEPGESNAFNRAQAAVQFLNHWQDYLFAQARGDEQEAANALRNLTSSNNGYNEPPLLPRSEILARLPANRTLNGESTTPRRTQADLDADVADVLDHTHTLDDIPAALKKLDALRAGLGNGGYNTSYNSDFSIVQTALQNYQKTRAELESGLGSTVSLTQTRNDPGNQKPAIEGKLVVLRAQLIVLALPRLLNAPGEKPVAGEDVAVFLRRLIELAKKREDWASVLHGLEIVRALATTTNGGVVSNNQEQEGFKQFFTGLNMEAAGQYQQAVIAYLNALKTGLQDLPVSLIGARLAAIQTAHANDYAAGNTYVLNPPAPQYPGGPYGPRGMIIDPRTGRPTYPGMMNPEPTPPSVLTVPAAPTATPAATVAPTPAPGH